MHGETYGDDYRPTLRYSYRRTAGPEGWWATVRTVSASEDPATFARHLLGIYDIRHGVNVDEWDSLNGRWIPVTWVH